eukprot:TRINITY_DN8695_c0_g1_i3.p1 TRINITY_DN8695_c0_g1~~TRINITY_DN8695_c0_g1_i3.p1  ORF type:complete len:682 (+),score=101.13 TRINITY_DN8695_c0_g1_i3:44-2089(+)
MDGNGKNPKGRVSAKTKTKSSSKRSHESRAGSNDGPKFLLARGISVTEYAEARAQEIKAMQQASRTQRGNKRSFQSLPRHMRRRATSHNIKRLPVALRTQAEHEFANVTPKQPRSRRGKRRPGRIREEFGRRSQRQTWMETHLWHAKRYHVEDRWGYRIPVRPSEKGQRPNYRWVRDHASMQDISYLSTYQLANATLDAIKDLLQQLSGQQCPVVSGYEHRCVVMEDHSRRIIGPLQYHVVVQDSATPTAMLTFHPACREAMVSRITTVAAALAITATDITEEVCRFRLLGPTSTQLLNRVFHRVTSDPVPSSHAVWDKLATASSPSELPAGAIVALKVWDPRLIAMDELAACKQEELAEDTQGTVGSSRRATKALHETLERWPSDIAASSLHDPQQRQHASKSLCHTKELNKRRSNMLIPAQSLEPTEMDTQVPVLLIQQPSNGGFASGWDLVIPARWGMAFWVPLVYAGARTHGQVEMKRLALEAGICMFPDDAVGSLAYDSFRSKQEAKRKKESLKRPPAKRNNYDKLNEPSPFIADWSSLCGDSVYTLSSHEHANMMQGIEATHNQTALVHARVTMLGKGKIDDRCRLFCPHEDDMASLRAAGPKVIQFQPDRTHVGNTTNGCNSFAHGRGVGHALIVAKHYATAPVLDDKRLVLIKHPDCRYFAFASMHVVVPNFV